jgi:hypothetical protein
MSNGKKILKETYVAEFKILSKKFVERPGEKHYRPITAGSRT